jgi:hypothetical protein
MYTYQTKEGKPARTCPACQQDFTKRESVEIVVSVGGHVMSLFTNLDKHGILQDIDNIVWNGCHSLTLCESCHNPLRALFVEIQGRIQEK